MTPRLRLVSLVGAAAALPLALMAVALASGAPRAGFWESAPLTQRGESASVLVRRVAGRTLVTNISTPSPDCRGQFGIFGEPGARLPRLPVDGRGRFRGARRDQTDGIAAVDGRFIGRRPRRAVLRARWRSGPAAPARASGSARCAACRSRTDPGPAPTAATARSGSRW